MLHKAFIIILSLITSCLVGTSQPKSTKSTVKIRTVVIDPGHGGKHPGAVNGKILEKDITLNVSKMFGQLIAKNYPDIKIIYTRETDKFISLNDRSKIANQNNADLFISIHANSSTSKSATGTETLVMGPEMTESNMEVCQLENSVITLEEDYSSNYSGFEPDNPESYIIFSLLQNSHLEQSLIFASLVQDELKKGDIKRDRGVKQAPMVVLWKCTMPSVLVELGFMSNKEDLKHLASNSGQKKMAESLFQSFAKYEESSRSTLELPTAEKDSIKNIAPSTENDKKYTIQVMALSRNLKNNSRHFKGLDCTYFKSGNLYKYVYGSYNNLIEAEAALKNVKEKFPEAFIIPLENTK